MGLLSCNKEAKVMNKLEGNWNVETSTVIIRDSLGNEISNETQSNAGELVLFEDPDNPSKESLMYLFTFMQDDTLLYQSDGMLFSDERKKRVIMEHALSDSAVYGDIVWTVEKLKNRRQVWTTFGVDGELFYPNNNNNPGDASNWVYWTIELKLE
jgi:hypothetical protein